jgi:two-component system CheB/CheR fusion protein
MARKKTAIKPGATPVIAKQTGTELSNGSQFPIVGVGASAGGLEAFTQLFKNLPADPGMAFVLIQHLAPAHESMLLQFRGDTGPYLMPASGEASRFKGAFKQFDPVV